MLVLVDEQPGGVLADRQTTAQPVGLVVVIYQHCCAVAVARQAVDVERAEFFWPSAGVDGQLDSAAHHRRAHLVEVCADLAHDLDWEITAGFGGFGLVGHICDTDREILAQAGRWPAGAGQAHGPGPGQDLADFSAGPDPGIGADLAGCLQVSKPVQEGFHGWAVQVGGDLASVGTHPQALRQPGHTAQMVTHGQAASAGGRPALGEIISGPTFRDFAQPPLRDVRERQRAGMPEHHQVPFVVDNLGFGT